MILIDDKYYELTATGMENCTKCAAFDLDGTMIQRKNGEKPWLSETNSKNYVFCYNVEKKIRKLISKNILPIIISNQLNFTDEKAIMMKRIYDHFECKISIYVAHLDNKYRKPRRGFYKLLSKTYEFLFYCGDAVGNSDFLPYNFSDCDRKFAKKCEMTFYTPREYFGSIFDTYVPEESLVIMIGLPGSGKTTFCKRLKKEHGFKHFSQDKKGTLTSKKNMERIERALKKGKQVILDACHRKKSLRQPFIDLAKEMNLSYLQIWIPIDGRSFNEQREHKVPHFPFTSYVKEFEEPKKHFVIIT